MKPAYACPKCSSTDLVVEVTDTAEFTQHEDGNIELYVTHDAPTWNSESVMTCRSCDHQDEAKRFRRELE